MCWAVLLVLIGLNTKRMALWSTAEAHFSLRRPTYQPVREATYEGVRGQMTYSALGFDGVQTDETGLVYMDHRYYYPGMGTFSSLDPMLSRTMLPFAYVDDTPTIALDPTGEVMASLGGGGRDTSTQTTAALNSVFKAGHLPIRAVVVNTRGTQHVAVFNVVPISKLPVPERYEVGVRVSANGSVELTPTFAVVVGSGGLVFGGLSASARLIWTGVTGSGVIEGSILNPATLGEALDALGPLLFL